MKTMPLNFALRRWRVWLAAAFCAGCALPVLAENTIQSITATQQSGAEVVRIELSEPLAALPGGFTVQTPPRVAIDLPNIGNAMGKSLVDVNQGNLRSVVIAQAGERTRLVLNLRQSASYRAELQGKALVIILEAVPAPVIASVGTAEPVHFSASQNRDQVPLRDIDFRRGADGAGRVIVALANTQVGVDIRQQGQTLVVEFLKSSLPENLRRRLDVSDFGTPVQAISTTQAGERVRMVVEPRGAWEHSAYQNDNQFVLEVRPSKLDPNKLVQGPGFSGEKLSLNFQNIEVRSLLQVIADFTNFNVVTSDTVTGSVTLRLKDVPWDQALDIILQSRGLGVRKSGNVLWIAPKDELAVKEQVDLESKKKIAELEPVRTQSFQLNYTKAEDVAKGLTGQSQGSSSGGGGAGSSAAQSARILTPRGSVIFEARTNQLFVSLQRRQLKVQEAVGRRAEQRQRKRGRRARTADVAGRGRQIHKIAVGERVAQGRRAAQAILQSLGADRRVVAANGDVVAAAERQAGHATLNPAHVGGAELDAQRSAKGVVGLDDAGLDQHLADRDIDLRDQGLDFFEFGRDVGDEQLVGAGLKNHAATRRQDARRLGCSAAGPTTARTAALALPG